MWRKKKIARGSRRDRVELENPGRESKRETEKEENSDGVKTEREEFRNGGWEPNRE